MADVAADAAVVAAGRIWRDKQIPDKPEPQPESRSHGAAEPEMQPEMQPEPQPVIY